MVTLLAACTANTATTSGEVSGCWSWDQGVPVGSNTKQRLLRPAAKYLGVALDGVPRTMEPLHEHAERTGKKPNLIEWYTAWGSGFDTYGVNNAWSYGALSFISWEPFSTSIREIADGVSDDYVTSFAAAVRDVCLPVAISFAHEMNAHWYPWGSRTTEPGDLVRAWRHVHDLFRRTGATNVIWVWAPNSIQQAPEVPLAPLYPGDSYVDWVGLTGYYTSTDPGTFADIFGSTLRQVRKFTKRPLVIAETGSEEGERKPKDVADVFTGVASSADFVGLIWFNYDKVAVGRADWRIESDPAALEVFREHAADRRFGFDVRRP